MRINHFNTSPIAQLQDTAVSDRFVGLTPQFNPLMLTVKHQHQTYYLHLTTLSRRDQQATS